MRLNLARKSEERRRLPLRVIIGGALMSGCLLAAGCLHSSSSSANYPLSSEFRRISEETGQGIVHIEVRGGKLSDARKKELLDEYRKEDPFNYRAIIRAEDMLNNYDLPPGSGSGRIMSSRSVPP